MAAARGAPAGLRGETLALPGTVLQQRTSAAAQPRLPHRTEPAPLTRRLGSAHQFAAASASLPLPLARPPTPPLAARGTRSRLLVATSFCVGLRGGWHTPHRGGRRGGGLATPLAPLPRAGLGPPPPVCTAGRDWAPPDSPRAGCCFLTPPRCQTPVPQGPAAGPSLPVCPGRPGGARTLVPSCPQLVRSGWPIPRAPPTMPSVGLSASGPESLPPPCPTPPSPPPLPGSRRSASLAPRPHPSPAEHAGAFFPTPTPELRGLPVLLHTLGKVPGSRGCVWEVCDAQTCPHASSYTVTTEDCGSGAQSAGRPPPGHLGGRARTYARTHARAHTSLSASGSPATRRTVTWAHRAAVGAGSRARADLGVRESAPLRAVRGAGARPSRTEDPARRRGGVWVSDAAQPLWAAPGSVPPAASHPGRRLQLHRSRDRCK